MKHAQRVQRHRELEKVPADLVFEQTGSECDYCSFPVNPEKGWVKFASPSAWLGGLLLWTEVRLAHQVCHEHERHFRKLATNHQEGDTWTTT